MPVGICGSGGSLSNLSALSPSVSTSVEPNSKLSGVKIQELNDAKKAELADAKN